MGGRIDRPFQTAEQRAERVADYFAACLLVPKRVVKRLALRRVRIVTFIYWISVRYNMSHTFGQKYD